MPPTAEPESDNEVENDSNDDTDFEEEAPEENKESRTAEEDDKEEVVDMPNDDEENTPQEEKTAEEAPVAQEEHAENTPEKDNGIFKLNTVKTPGINVVGKIDLSAINQQTRPKKKSKEEKRKEREAKEKQRVDNKRPAPATAPETTENDGERKKRKRIKKERIDIEHNIDNSYSSDRHNNGNNKPQPSKLKKPVKAEVNEEDVQKQIKETLARLTAKGQKKSAKWRKEKREAFSTRAQEAAEREMEESRILKLTEFVTANDLASLMDVPVNKVIATCMSLGIMVSINQRLDAETINIVAEEFGFQTEYVSAEVAESMDEEEDSEENISPNVRLS